VRYLDVRTRDRVAEDKSKQSKTVETVENNTRDNRDMEWMERWRESKVCGELRDIVEIRILWLFSVQFSYGRFALIIIKCYVLNHSQYQGRITFSHTYIFIFSCRIIIKLPFGLHAHISPDGNIATVLENAATFRRSNKTGFTRRKKTAQSQKYFELYVRSIHEPRYSIQMEFFQR